MATTLLFDFDGTIAQTFRPTIQILRRIGKEYGIKNLSDDEIEELREDDVKTIFRKMQIPLWRLPFIVMRVKKELASELTNIEVADGLQEVLDKLQNQNIQLGIVSSNNEDNIRTFLHHHNMTMFDFMYCEKNLFGKAKVLRKVMKKYHLTPLNTLYVGDEIRDIQASQEVCIKCVAVTWGFNSKSGLEKYKPDYIIEKPKELLKIVDHK